MIGIVCRRVTDKAIGANGIIPWYVPEDLQYFRSVTSRGSVCNICIMGRKTYQSLGSFTLTGRFLFVISQNPDFKLPEDVTEEYVRIYRTPREAMEAALKMNSPENIFVCGGESIYRELIPYCSSVHVTEVYRPEDVAGDAFFPNTLLRDFEIQGTSGIRYSKIQGIPYEFVTYRRIHQEDSYLRLCERILTEGDRKDDRTGVGTISYFGPQLTYDLSGGEFPLLTTKRVFWKGVVEELLWFVRGETDADILSQRGVRIWDGNTSREFLDRRGLQTYKVGDIGPGYGFQWRRWGAEYLGKGEKTHGGIDQLAEAIRQIRECRESRRIIVSAWNVTDLDKMALPPCHLLFQFNVVEGGFLDLKMYQRSADWFLGVPFNIASYALLLNLVCRLTGRTPRRLILTFGDAHIYTNHVEQIKVQLTRTPFKFPKLSIVDRGQTAPEDFIPEDFQLVDYVSHPSIRAEMAI